MKLRPCSSAVFSDHAPLFNIQVFAKFQMTHTRSGRLYNFQALKHAFVQQVASSLPSPPSWLALVSTEVGTSIFTEFLCGTVPGGGCRSLGCHGYLHPAERLLFT